MLFFDYLSKVNVYVARFQKTFHTQQTATDGNCHALCMHTQSNYIGFSSYLLGEPHLDE